MRLANDINIMLIAVFFVCLIAGYILYIINWILGLFKSNDAIKTISKYIVKISYILSIVMMATMTMTLIIVLIMFISNFITIVLGIITAMVVLGIILWILDVIFERD